MILLFDVGNTSVYTGISDGVDIIKTFRLNTEIDKTPDEYFILLKELIDPSTIQGVVIGSVVPPVTRSLLKLSQKYFNIEPIIIQPGVKTGVFVKADNPKEVGADLIADVAGLKTKLPTLIIDLGTANKFIYAKDGQIHGVIISPGVVLSIKALAGNTALLHEVEVKAPPKYLGNNTVTCIQSGVIYGTVVMIEGMIGRIKEEVKEDFEIIITGGLSKVILEHVRVPMTRDSHLVLRGLLNIYHKNQ